MKKVEKLFHLYSSNLSFHFPELENKFVCPICLRIFSKDSIFEKELTIEHIIPSSLGGTFLTLTCKDCNRISGTILDGHLTNRLRTEDKLAGIDESPLRGEIIIDSQPITADIFLSADGPTNIKIIAIPELNDPIKLKSATEKLDEKTNSFQISGNLGYRDLSSRVAVLKIAYLMIFSYFGYGYIKYDFLDSIRNQIMNPSEETEMTKGLVYLDSLPFEKSCISILYKPKELSCFFVALDLSTKKNRFVGVVLPGFDNNQELYSHWKNINLANYKINSDSIMPISYKKIFLSNKEYSNFSLGFWHYLKTHNQ